MTPDQITLRRNFGALILAERTRQGLTQPDLAKLAGVSIPTILTLEKGAKSTHIGSVLAIAAALGLSLSLVHE